MTLRRTTALAALAAALLSVTAGCDRPEPVAPPSESTSASTVPTSPAASSTPTASTAGARLAKTPQTQRGEVARSVVSATPKPPSASSVVGPDDVSGTHQQLSGACVDAEGDALTYRVLDAAAHAKGSVAARTITTGSLRCDGRVHQQQLDLSRSDSVQLSVTGGLDNAGARGWLLITNGDVKLR